MTQKAEVLSPDVITQPGLMVIKSKLTNNIIEGHFFIYGGKQSDKGQLSDVFCFNIESLAWKKFFTMEAPLPRSQHVSVRS